MNAEQASVAFFAPFSDFHTPAVPRDAATYAELMTRSIAFVEARNSRIAAWAKGQADLRNPLAQRTRFRPQRRLKYCTARSCFSAAARVGNVPRLRRCPVLGSFFRE